MKLHFFLLLLNLKFKWNSIDHYLDNCFWKDAGTACGIYYEWILDDATNDLGYVIIKPKYTVKLYIYINIYTIKYRFDGKGKE